MSLQRFKRTRDVTELPPGTATLSGEARWQNPRRYCTGFAAVAQCVLLG